jgi:hypothetical protein
MNAIKTIELLCIAVFLSAFFQKSAQAQTFCVYDPLGTSGDYFSLFKDYQVAARRWHVNIDLKAYSDDIKLDEAMKSDQCDMASMIGVRARLFNQFTGTIDSPGGLNNYVQVSDLLRLLSSPRSARLMISGSYEVVGILPIGAAYAVVNDRRINSIGHAAGKRIAVVSWDPSLTAMVEFVKATPVPMDLTQFGPKFNSGQVDVIAVPAALYKPLELYKGLGTSGGIVRRPLGQFTMQIVAKRSKFPPQFGQNSRDYIGEQLVRALATIRNQENEIDSRSWIYATRSDLAEWNDTMRGLTESLTKARYFDGKMLLLLKRIRCKDTPDVTECSANSSSAPQVAP